MGRRHVVRIRSHLMWESSSPVHRRRRLAGTTSVQQNAASRMFRKKGAEARAAEQQHRAESAVPRRLRMLVLMLMWPVHQPPAFAMASDADATQTRPSKKYVPSHSVHFLSHLCVHATMTNCTAAGKSLLMLQCRLGDIGLEAYKMNECQCTFERNTVHAFNPNAFTERGSATGRRRNDGSLPSRHDDVVRHHDGPQ